MALPFPVLLSSLAPVALTQPDAHLIPYYRSGTKLQLHPIHPHPKSVNKKGAGCCAFVWVF